MGHQLGIRSGFLQCIRQHGQAVQGQFAAREAPAHHRRLLASETTVAVLWVAAKVTRRKGLPARSRKTFT